MVLSEILDDGRLRKLLIHSLVSSNCIYVHSNSSIKSNELILTDNAT